MVRGPDIKGLARFSRETDRYLTDFFSGRGAEIEFIRDRLEQVSHRHARKELDPAAGTTILITGVQGAGKTSLIQKLKADWSDHRLLKPLIVSLSKTEISSYRDLADALARELAVHGGDLGNVDIACVKRQSASLRAEYYEQRTSGMLARSPYLLARVMDKIPDDGLDEYGVIELIEDLAEVSDKRRNRLPDGVGPSEFFDSWYLKDCSRSRVCSTSITFRFHPCGHGALPEQAMPCTWRR